MDFAQVTEVLKKDVLLFVNEVAEIVHDLVDQNLGAANKNIGDAFLLVWKVPDEELHMVDDQITSKGEMKTEILADLSIYSFICIIAEINKNKKLNSYSQNSALNKSFGPGGYKLKMGFGLHIGWAIEGAIGSKYKIDASYLSPNVNMAARLEAATKQFGVIMLISGDLYRFCSVGYKKLMRKVDKVTVKGSSHPMELYTIDLDIKKLQINHVEDKKLTPQESRKMKVQAKKNRVSLRKRLLKGEITTYDILQSNDDFKQMRNSYKPEFFDRWAIGMEHYLEGKWLLAWKIFKETRTMMPGIIDGPSETLISVTGEEGKGKPEDWAGYRKLTSK